MSTAKTANHSLESRDLAAEQDPQREPTPPRDPRGKPSGGIQLRTGIKAGILPAPLNQ